MICLRKLFRPRFRDAFCVSSSFVRSHALRLKTTFAANYTAGAARVPPAAACRRRPSFIYRNSAPKRRAAAELARDWCRVHRMIRRITYFKAISEDVGIPYQSLINLYLRDCAASHRKRNLN